MSREEQISIANKIQKELIKKHEGMNIIYDSSVLVERKRHIIPVSPCIDLVLGGGIMEGTWTILSGAPKVGKTCTALQIAANAQKLYNKFVYYFAIESRIKPRDLTGIKGFNLDLCKIIQSEKGCILTAEDYLNDAMAVIKGHPGCIVILDSASALCSSGEFSKDITATGRADGPKLLASFCRQMAGVVPANDVTVITIQHLIANTSGYGPLYIEDGGQKIKYQFDTKLRCKGLQKWTEGEKSKKQIGNILTWEVVGSPLAPPGTSCESYLLFNHGLDVEMELITVGNDLGLISRAGAWYNFDFMNDNPDFKELIEEGIKFGGLNKAKQFISDNTPVKDYLFKRIKELS